VLDVGQRLAVPLVVGELGPGAPPLLLGELGLRVAADERVDSVHRYVTAGK
jgi:hypothetical protein